ncbi:ATP-dependent translocase ABCB1-like [Schistocerca piceifrons]|uniref:ATP-dependent translocase ABCB1-like n=1 Tax=Schistocerca piceifrons TaxID=274613 RepID=UPI001F5F66F3|nr:ATP-dependent translocase ABCB1-like [Schistocerca piceifrons]
MASEAEVMEGQKPLLRKSEEEKNRATDEMLSAGDKPEDGTPSSTETEATNSKEQQVEEALPPVPFLKLFRFSSTWEHLLLFAGLVAGLGSGVTQPAGHWLLGDLTKVMVDFGTATVNASMANVTLPDQEVNVFLAGIRHYAIYSAVLGIANFSLSYVSTFIFKRVSNRQMYRIRDLYLESVLRQDISWHDTQRTGDLASRISGQLQELNFGIGELMVQFAMQLVSHGGALAVAVYRGWELSLACLAAVPLTAASLKAADSYTSRLCSEEAGARGKASAVAEEVLGAIRTVVAFGGQQKEVQRFNKKLQDAVKVGFKRNLAGGLYSAISSFSVYIVYAVASWYGVYLFLRDKEYPKSQRKYDAATVITVFYSVTHGSSMFSSLSAYIEMISEARGTAAKVFSVIDRKPDIDSLSEEGEKPYYAKGDVTFKNVHFEYPSRKEIKVLQGLNLKIKAGETVALVGSSGCGKSTCMQLIQRFYDPVQGTVELDGRDMKTLNVGWLRSQIGVVSQEPVLFHATIAENIRYGREGCSMQEIEEVAKVANAHGFISKLPQGYDTLVGERGAQLSGGQKQRIAIARALVRRPKILLLDEATSALDTSSEAKVQAALDKASMGRTTIIVAHRLSTIRNADRILVVSGGAVVEEGSHDQLMALKSQYHALVTTQLSAADVDDKVKGDRPALERMVSDRGEAPSEEHDSEGKACAADEDASDEEEPVTHVGLRGVLRLNAPEWPLALTNTVCTTLRGFASSAASVVFADVIGVFSLSDTAEMRRQAIWFTITFLVIAVTSAAIGFLQTFASRHSGTKLKNRLQSLMFSAMLRQEMAWFDKKSNSTGALCERLSGIHEVHSASAQYIGYILDGVVTLVLSVGLCAYHEWRMGLVVVAFLPASVALHYYEHGKMLKDMMSVWDAMEKASKLAVETVGNIRTVAGLCRERHFHQQYLAELRPALQREERNSQIRSAVYIVTGNISTLSYAACMYYGGLLIHSQGMHFKDVFKVSDALSSVSSSLTYVPYFILGVRKGLIAASKLFHLLNRQSKIADPRVAAEDTWVTRGDVSYCGVEFCYPTRPGAQVLRGLDLAVQPGQTVALVGPSGGGKSTCVQLLQRFYDPNSGTVALGEYDVSSIRLSSLRAQLGMVQQEPVLFNRTIAENIAYGDNSREVTMEEIIKVAKKANIHKFVESLPQGYATHVGEKGIQLSGGQKQRVAIARALVRNPPVLLLDEATSALDAESEKVVQEALDNAKEGRTCITIAHRLSTVQDADVICVISDGKVVEMGKHANLLAKRGVYYKLQGLQPN